MAGTGVPAGKKCWDCGAPGKIQGDGYPCPTPNSGKFDTCDNCESCHSKGGCKGGGKGGGKGGPGHALANPYVVDYPNQTPPKAYPQA